LVLPLDYIKGGEIAMLDKEVIMSSLVFLASLAVLVLI